MTALLAVASASPYLLYSGDAQDADPSQRYYGYYGLGYHGYGYGLRSAEHRINPRSTDQSTDPSQRYYGYYGLGYHGLGYRSANKDSARPSADTSTTVRAYGYGYPYAYGHYGYYGWAMVLSSY